MPIPGLTLSYEVRAKVKIGEKGERGARSLDYFISDDPEFQTLIQGGRNQQIPIVLPHAEVEDNFNTGLEWWVKTKQGKNQLACYTKGDGTALRLPPYVEGVPQEQIIGERPTGRIQIQCPFRECPQFKQDKGGCKPMGRLVFFLEGGRTDAVLELDTKSWNSIERLTAALTGARTRGPLTGRKFTLAVAYESKGNKRFPVLSLQEVGVALVDEQGDVTPYANAILSYTRMGAEDAEPNAILAAMLDSVRPGWRDDQAYIDRIKEVGVQTALDKLVERCLTEVGEAE